MGAIGLGGAARGSLASVCSGGRQSMLAHAASGPVTARTEMRWSVNVLHDLDRCFRRSQLWVMTARSGHEPAPLSVTCRGSTFPRNPPNTHVVVGDAGEVVTIQRPRGGWVGGLHAELAVEDHVDAAANHVGRGLLFFVVQIFDAGRKVVGYRELPAATRDPADLVRSERAATGGV